MGEKPSLLQLLHHIANRGWRQADRPRERLRPDRHPALEIGFDHQAEDIAHAVRQFADGLGHADPSRIARNGGLGTPPTSIRRVYASVRPRARSNARTEV